MSLNNRFQFDDKKDCKVSCLYSGDKLPCDTLDNEIRQGFFNGEYYDKLYHYLIQGQVRSIWWNDLSHSDIKNASKWMRHQKEELFSDRGREFWQEYQDKVKDFFISTRSSKLPSKLYSYEEVISFILMFEWYAQREEEIILKGWY